MNNVPAVTYNKHAWLIRCIDRGNPSLSRRGSLLAWAVCWHNYGSPIKCYYCIVYNARTYSVILALPYTLVYSVSKTYWPHSDATKTKPYTNWLVDPCSCSATVLNVPPCTPSLPLLQQLHRLPIEARISYKLCFLMYSHPRNCATISRRMLTLLRHASTFCVMQRL